MKFLFLFLFLVSMLNSSFSQEKIPAQKNLFERLLVETNTIYKPPKQYTSIDVNDEVHHFCATATSRTGTYLYGIKNEVSDICILFILFPTMHQDINDDFQVDKRINPNFKYGPDQNFLGTIRGDADTSISKVYYFNKKELKKINADRAARFVLKPAYSGGCLNKYIKCKVAMLSQYDIGDVMIFYFYTHESQKDLNKVMKSTKYILRFQKREEYKPVIFKESYERWLRHKDSLKLENK